MQVHRFQSPFKHWASGLVFEIAVVGVYLVLVAVVVVAIIFLL